LTEQVYVYKNRSAKTMVDIFFLRTICMNEIFVSLLGKMKKLRCFNASLNLSQFIF